MIKHKFPAKWTVRRLDQLGSVSRGRSRHRPRNEPSLYGGVYPFFQTGDIKAANLYLFDYAQTYNEKGLSQSKIWEPGTLCITIAANIADTAILTIRACFPDSVIGFIADPKKADVHFIKYYIDWIKLDMQQVSHGTTQDNLSLDKILRFDFVVPDVREQRKIAAILSAYDDLIENNLRRIKILEEMAQNLYREWFVKFRFPGHEQARFVDSPLGMIPEGWKVLQVKDIADVNARSIRKEKTPAEIAYVDISSVSSGSINKIETIAFSKAPGRARKVVQHGDVIWSSVRPNLRSFSLIVDPPSNLIVSTGFAVISAKKVPFTFLYQALTTEDFVSYLVNHAKGSAYPAVGTADFENACVVVPCKKLLNTFDNEMLPIAIITNRLKVKNTTLRRTRDMLLPKLISGEVDVSKLDITISEEAAA